jgi:hypothetical protein
LWQGKAQAIQAGSEAVSIAKALLILNDEARMSNDEEMTKSE